MAYSEIYLYSPLSPNTVYEEPNRSLLLQFILSEIFHANTYQKDDPLAFVFSSPACFFPYDWSHEVGCLNKIQEHGRLLGYAFPRAEKTIEQFHLHLNEALQYIIDCHQCGEEVPSDTLKNFLGVLNEQLFPFLLLCKESENLLLFLLKNADEWKELCGPSSLTILLNQMYPEGLEKMSHLLRKGYQSRGFDTLLPEIDRLLSAHVR